MNPILEIKDLNIFFQNKRSKKSIHAIRNLNLSLNAGEILGIVGESGCGKSLTNLAIMGLLPAQARANWTEFKWLGKNYSTFRESQWSKFRGSEIGMIFQNPMSSLNPTLSLKYQFDEILKFHRRDLTAIERDKEAIDLLGRVGIPAPKERLTSYPFELSGGMAQRVMIATVMATRPKLLIADEPTTALDVTIQNQVLKLIKDIAKDSNEMAVIFVTHDLSVVSHMADRINVMYAGEIVETGKTHNIIHLPTHPYTQALISSLPGTTADKEGEKLETIEGTVPHFSNRAEGCQFAPRCKYQREACLQPELLFPRQDVLCIFPMENQR